MGVSVFALEARVTTGWTNRRRLFAHVDVMKQDSGEGGVGVLAFCVGLCSGASYRSHFFNGERAEPIALCNFLEWQQMFANRLVQQSSCATAVSRGVASETDSVNSKWKLGGRGPSVAERPIG